MPGSIFLVRASAGANPVCPIHTKLLLLPLPLPPAELLGHEVDVCFPLPALTSLAAALAINSQLIQLPGSLPAPLNIS